MIIVNEMKNYYNFQKGVDLEFLMSNFKIIVELEKLKRFRVFYLFLKKNSDRIRFFKLGLFKKNYWVVLYFSGKNSMLKHRRRSNWSVKPFSENS